MAKIKSFINQLKKGQKEFGEDIAVIINSVLLSMVYLFGVGLTSLAAKVFRKKFLDLETNKKAVTYWQDLNLAKKPINEYYKQF